MSSVEDIVENVVNLRKMKHFKEAEAILRGAIDSDSKTWELWNQLGHVLVAVEKYREAASAFETATQLNPNGFWLWLSLGYARKENIQLKDAIDATLRTTKLTTKPNELGSALYNLGCYHCMAGRHHEAIEYLDKAFEVDQSIRSWAFDDPDLESLKTDERFRRILESN